MRHFFCWALCWPHVVGHAVAIAFIGANIAGALILWEDMAISVSGLKRLSTLNNAFPSLTI